MPKFLLVLEARAPAPQYVPLLDVLERRLGARRVLRTAWVIEAESAEDLHESIRMWMPVQDGVLILPFSEPRVERNLRS